MPRIALIAALFSASLAACSTPPADLDLSLKHASQQGRFMVELEAPASGPAIGQIHAWTLKLSTPEGQPVSRAQVKVDGGMPQHGHGLPTQPRVGAELAPGTYRIDGMKFSMTGWWDLRLDIRAADLQDQAVFNIVMANDGLKR